VIIDSKLKVAGFESLISIFLAVREFNFSLSGMVGFDLCGKTAGWPV
jgi:hypothetical protein